MCDTNITFSVYVVKYALTKGIFKMEVQYTGSKKESVVSVKNYNGNCKCFLRRSGYAFSLQEAVLKAEAMRDICLNSLEKRIHRIKNMEFRSLLREE